MDTGTEDENQLGFENKFKLHEDTQSMDQCSNIDEIRKRLIHLKYSIVIESESIILLQKYNHARRTMQYAVIGKFDEISAERFFAVQCDVQYRKNWDPNALCLNIVDGNIEYGRDLIHWICSYPSPLECREYLFTRNKWSYETKRGKRIFCYRAKGLPLANWGLFEGDRMEFDRTIKRTPVEDYEMEMMVIPNEHYQQPGLIYVMNYIDNTKAYVPGFIKTLILKYGLVSFLDRLKSASLSYEITENK